MQSREDKAEEQEKAKRKSNVIIHDLPEPQAPDASDNKEVQLTPSLSARQQCIYEGT